MWGKPRPGDASSRNKGEHDSAKSPKQRQRRLKKPSSRTNDARVRPLDTLATPEQWRRQTRPNTWWTPCTKTLRWTPSPNQMVCTTSLTLVLKVVFISSRKTLRNCSLRIRNNWTESLIPVCFHYVTNFKQWKRKVWLYLELYVRVTWPGFFYIAWFMVGFFRLAAARWTVPGRPTGRAPELCMAPPWGAKQAHRSSAPAWSPGKIRAGITDALTALWLTEVQCDAMWDFCTVTVVWAFSRSQHRGQWRSGGPWSSGPQWHEVTRIMALVLKYVLRSSGVWNVKVDDLKCGHVQ